MEAMQVDSLPLDETWSTLESLVLAHAVLKFGENNWPAVSNALKKYAETNSDKNEHILKETFSPNKCARKYSTFLDEQPRTKRSTPSQFATPVSQQTKALESTVHAVAEKFTSARIQQLKQSIKEREQYIQSLKEEMGHAHNNNVGEEPSSEDGIHLKKIKQEQQTATPIPSTPSTPLPPTPTLISYPTTPSVLPSHSAPIQQLPSTPTMIPQTLPSSPSVVQGMPISIPITQPLALHQQLPTPQTGDINVVMSPPGNEVGSAISSINGQHKDISTGSIINIRAMNQQPKILAYPPTPGVKEGAPLVGQLFAQRTSPNKIFQTPGTAGRTQQTTAGGVILSVPVGMQMNETSVWSNQQADTTEATAHSLSDADAPQLETSPIQVNEEVNPTVDHIRYELPIGSLFEEPTKIPTVESVNQQRKLDPETIKRVLLNVLKTISAHKHAEVFREPVSIEEAPDYDDIIKRRMDLSTIRAKVLNGSIRNASEFKRDLLLMFQNARIYNAKGSDIYVMAGQLQKYALKELDTSLAAEENPNKPVKSDRKKRNVKTKRVEELDLDEEEQMLLLEEEFAAEAKKSKSKKASKDSSKKKKETEKKTPKSNARDTKKRRTKGDEDDLVVDV